jgi:mannose-6-phosphate isomerase-like protein (cupin superfamily)
MPPFKLTLVDAIQQLSNKDKPFIQLMQHGTMQVEYFAPKGTDNQTPHKQDELYIITSGAGEFVRDGERVNCATHDVLFVPAGMEHRFENFSDDFSTWVIFYGTNGGENT